MNMRVNRGVLELMLRLIMLYLRRLVHLKLIWLSWLLDLRLNGNILSVLLFHGLYWIL